MVVGEASINNIMGGIENTGTVRLNNHKRKLKQRFDIIKKLGQGTYGKVQLGINKETGQEVAIKTIKKSKIETEADLIRIRREIQIMSSVQHPNIIHIYEVFENKEKMVLVMEYAAGGELYDYLYEKKMLVEEEARRIFRQISTACYYCHKHKICHRDLKLENILLDENKNAKIADFGLSNVFDDQRLLSTFCGSPLYASPEIVNGTPYHGPEVDCWSLGVLLYTLVYGAMPFDGSNFKRLVRQISQGDYFEPKQPSPASPLIMEMLTVNPKNRANIEKICAHWWVNEGYGDSCLEISEELANQTPVRLDVLLSLNPPPAQIESEKLVVTGEVAEEEMKAEPTVPTRSQSVGSLMEISTPERRINELIAQDVKTVTPKRKLETTVSTEQANVDKRKEKIVKENTIADISVQKNKPDDSLETDVKMVESVEPNEPQGAACTEIIEEAKKNEAKKVKVKKTMSTSLSPKILEEINENPSQENLYDENKPKEMVNEKEKRIEKENIVEEEKKPEVKEEVKAAPAKKKIVKKKVLSDKNEANSKAEVETKPDEVKEQSPTKPVERRQSRIFEQAEKFQNMISSSDSKSQVAEKPKKIVIPGVSVGGFKKEFERKASLTSVSPPKLKPTATKKLVIEDSKPEIEAKPEEPKNYKSDDAKKEVKVEDDQKQKLRNAVSIISNALDKEGARKSKSRPCMSRKPPVPFGASGRSASGSIAMISSPISPPPDIKRYIKVPTETKPLVQSSQAQQAKSQPEPSEPVNQTSSAEITLKSATLPRRKSAKAEIKLDYPQPKPATMEFKTEMAHKIQGPKPTLTSQRSEVMFPVNSPPTPTGGFRSASVEPETRAQKERIIPIAFDRQNEAKEQLQSPPTKPPVPRLFQTQKSSASQRSSSLSRQSTQESDNETVSGDPIKKSPREYIIPIAVEGGGYVTPRAGSLEPSETSSTVTNSSRKTTSTSKLGRPRRMISLFDRDGSEDESPFGTLHRHSSFGRQDSDTEGDSRKDSFPMHRLRSSRPRKSNLEHNDSLSSGEDDDDEDGFEFLTAENLFSTLLSRVRDLTQRINVDDRPGFPNSRLLSHFDHGTHFWNRRDPLSTARSSPLGRQFSRERSLNSSSSIPWRRSVSRDLASDIESVFNERTPSRTSSLPRGDQTDGKKENLNLSDLNLKKLKLTEEDALALSYLTPGLSRRIQKQLFASLPASEARKISRTLSMRNDPEPINNDESQTRRPVDRVSSSTLPRKFSYEKRTSSQQNLMDINQNKTTNNLPLASEEKSYLSPKKELVKNPRYYRASSLREPTDYKPKLHTSYSLRSPDSSLSEISSLHDDPVEAKPITRRISRFLRPDFFDPPKEDNIVVKEKKEREMETQKVLKEIRDKRIKNRISMRRERSMSRDQADEEKKKTEVKSDIVSDRKFVDSYRNALNLKEEKKHVDEKKEYSHLQDANGNEQIIKCKELLEALNEPSSKNLAKNTSNTTSNVESSPSANNNLLKNLSDTIKRKETSPPTNINALRNLSDGIKNKELSVQAKIDFSKNASDSIKIKELSPPANKLLKNVSGNIKNIESNVKAKEEGTVKKDRLSRLVRPKSYPTENGIKPTVPDESKPKVANKESKIKKMSPTKTPSDKPKNKFLQSIEKKFEKLRTFNNEEKTKEEKKSGVENAIKKLREQSVPRNVDHITESTLIKRAVSVEDFSNVKNKALQPSRKSVTKILGLFKKYEDKEKKEEQPENIPTISESNIPKAKSPERPKSLTLDKKKYNGARSDSTFSTKSKLPFKKSVNDNEMNNDVNRNSYTTDESSTMLSPCDETFSCDSWSVCSDFHHTQDLASPLSQNGNAAYSGDENESVIDRIRRKSFYTRFNEKKKPRKPSLVGNYKDLDLYKDYSQKVPSYRRAYSVEADREYRPYARSKSLVNDYVNVPTNRYQTYNPRRSNIASLYAATSATDDDETPSTGTFRKFSYSPNTSRIGSLNRGSRSPSSDFQYIPHVFSPSTDHHIHQHPTAATTLTSNISSPTPDAKRPVTEHAV